MHGHEISRTVCATLLEIPQKLDDSHLPKLISQLDRLNVCPGHPDSHYVTMVSSKKGTLLNRSGDIAAYVDNEYEVCFDKQRFSETVRTSDCLFLTKNTKCSKCMLYRDNLRSIYHKWLK